MNLQEIRSWFPILEREVNGHPLVYLDNAATTQRPRQVIEAVQRFYETYNANVHRSPHTLSFEATEAYERAHRAVARFIGASSWREVVFVRNATEGLNLFAYAWGLSHLQEGDEIVTTVSEHHSNLVPWQFLARRTGATLRVVDVDDEGRWNPDDIRRELSERTRLVALGHASNITGVVHPVQEVARAAHEAGALVVVDAAQSLPHLPVNVQALGADVLVASGHKMLGPMGIGLFWARREVLEEMDPFLYGGNMIQTVTLQEATWNELPWKFEAGTPNVAGAVGLEAALQVLEKVGMEAIYQHEVVLTTYALERLAAIPDVEVYGPRDVHDRIGVISFNLRGIHPHDVAYVLDQQGVAVRSGHHCAQPLLERLGAGNTVRASFYLYNTKEDVDRWIEALQRVRTILGVSS